MRLILQPFQKCEESLFVSLVCKLWHSLIEHKIFFERNIVFQLFFVTQIFDRSSLEIVDWAFHEILDKHNFIINNAARGLARSGCLDYLKILHNRGLLATDHPSSLCAAALYSGNLATVQWLFENLLYPAESNSIWSRNTRIPASRGYLDILKYLHEHGCAVINEVTFSAAAGGGHMHILQWLLDEVCKMSTHACAAAAEEGHLEVLKWLRENGCEWNEDSCASAARTGNYDILKWLRENGCEWDYHTCLAIASRGDLEMLKWAHSNGCNLSVAAASYAAEGGHLDTLKYIQEQEQDIQCTDRSASVAASRGHLHVLKWLKECGFEWTSEDLTHAAKCGHLDVVKWLIEEAKCDIDSHTAMEVAKDGKLEVLKYLVEIGCKLDERCCSLAAGSGYLKVLQWLVDNGCPWNREELEKISINKKRLREWLANK